MITMAQYLDKPITKQDIKHRFDTDDVYQYGSKQLFLVKVSLLVSYKTIIGISKYNHTSGQHEWYITTKVYSKTTSRHISWWAYNHRNLVIHYVDQSIIDSMVASHD